MRDDHVKLCKSNE